MKLKPEIVDTILNSAESLFNQYGYCPVSLESIAENAQVSKRTLYKYFGDKNGLVLAVLIRRDIFFKSSLTNIVTVFNDAIDKINAIISWHIRWFSHDDYHGCMFIRAQAEYGDQSQEINDVAKKHKQWIQNLIDECLGGNKASRDVSLLIMLVLEGMISRSLLFGTKDHGFTVEKKYIFRLIENMETLN